MSIPTGADYHILRAKSHLDYSRAMGDCDLKTFRLEDAIDELVKALELIQQEREKEKE